MIQHRSWIIERSDVALKVNCVSLICLMKQQTTKLGKIKWKMIHNLLNDTVSLQQPNCCKTI